MTIAVGKSREIILGLVLGCFVREGAVNPITKHVDQRKWTRSAGSAAMDIRAAATSSIFRRCRWTNGAVAEALRLSPRGKIDAVRGRWRPICFVRGSFRRACQWLVGLEGTTRCK